MEKLVPPSVLTVRHRLRERCVATTVTPSGAAATSTVRVTDTDRLHNVHRDGGPDMAPNHKGFF